MAPYFSNDPTVYDDLDGLVVSEISPPPAITGAAANIACLVGQFQRGPLTLTDVGSIGELYEIFGKGATPTKGEKALRNKKFGRLRVIRVAAAAAAKATKIFTDGGGTPVDIITFTAKYKGVYGNSITVTIAAGSTTGKKYTIKDTSSTTVLPDEVYDNVVVTAITASTFAASKLVDVTVLATSAEPANASATALATGSEGSVADSDYQSAIAVAAGENSCNVLFLDEYTDTRNGYLETHAAETQDKMVLLTGAEADAYTDAVTDAAGYRDTDGRVVFMWNFVQTTIDGVSEYRPPCEWLACIISQTSPHIDPSYAKNAQFTVGATGLKNNPTRAAQIALKDAGVCSFYNDSEIGILVKSPVVTQIADSTKRTIMRRRMADWLIQSASNFLKLYQGAPNSKENRTNVKAAILNFVDQAERDKILPKDSELKAGKAKLVDTESLNTDASIGAGMFKILWRQRIYSSMRFIVLQAEIGETVVVTEQAA